MNSKTETPLTDAVAQNFHVIAATEKIQVSQYVKAWQCREIETKLKRERDDAREAYETETLSTLEMGKRILELESEVSHWRNKHSELFMAANPISTDCPPADTGYACDYARHKRDVPCGICPLKSKREAAEFADEKPDGQAENANVDLPDTAAQDSASKLNNPAVSG